MNDPVDVLIVGAGASGAAVAWSLAETKMHILCLEQGGWMNPMTYPTTGRDWEARFFGDFSPSPNIRARPEDYPINDDNSPIKVVNFNGVGGGTVMYTAHFPRLHPSDFRVKTLDGVADDWPIDYDTLVPFFEENDRMMGMSGLAGDPGVAEWTRDRGASPRLYPASLIWCLRKPGRELRDAIEHMLAWRRVEREIREGLLGAEFDQAERVEVRAEVKTAEDAAKDQVWSGYRFVVVSDAKAPTGLKVIDLGAGHSSERETLCGRMIAALKNEGLLNEGIGTGYIDRHWPPAFKESGAWPVGSLRQSLLNGTLTRLIDPDTVLRARIAEFVSAGEFGLASGAEPEGKYRRIWFREDVSPTEITFEADVYLLTKALAEKLKSPEASPVTPPTPEPAVPQKPAIPESPHPDADGSGAHAIIAVVGSIPVEQWNRLGTRLIPKMRAAGTVTATIRLEIEIDQPKATAISTELRQIIEETGLSGTVRVDQCATE
jgi:choline dehydrogenase-like flavoprotein